MMEEKAWPKLHLSLRGPQPCEKNCYGMSQDIRKVCTFLFSPFFSQLMMEEKAWFKFISHWEALNLVKRIQNQCDAASECLDMSEYFAIFFFHDPLPRYVRKDNPNCTSPNWCYLHLSPCSCLTFSMIVVPNLITWNLEEEEYKFLWISPISSGTPLYKEGMTFSNQNVQGLVKRTDVILPQCYHENAHRVPL